MLHSKGDLANSTSKSTLGRRKILTLSGALFPIKFWAKKVVLFSLKWYNEISPFWPLWKLVGYPRKNPLLDPPLKKILPTPMAQAFLVWLLPCIRPFTRMCISDSVCQLPVTRIATHSNLNQSLRCSMSWNISLMFQHFIMIFILDICFAILYFI